MAKKKPTYPDGITELTYKGYRITKNGSTFDLFDVGNCFVNVCETVEDAIEYVDFLTEQK